jgi:hypothetical protein
VSGSIYVEPGLYDMVVDLEMTDLASLASELTVLQPDARGNVAARPTYYSLQTVADVFYRLDDGEWQAYGGRVALPDDAEVIEAYARSHAGIKGPVTRQRIVW